MRYLILQHVDYESPGIILDWLDGRGLDYVILRPDREKFPSVGEFQRVIIMGGPMGVNDGEQYPWLREEKRFIRDFLSSGGKALGICLGAQLLAEVLGAKVRSGVCDEFGWKEVYLTGDARKSRYFYDFPARFPAFHWHSDAFDIPPGAINPASTRECPDQVVETGNVLGIQFHLEMTPQMVEEAIRITGRDAGSSDEDAFRVMRGLMFKILDRL